MAVGSFVDKLLPLVVTMLHYSDFNYSNYYHINQILTISKRFAKASSFPRAAVKTFMTDALAEQSRSTFLSGEVNQMREMLDVIDADCLKSCSWSAEKDSCCPVVTESDIKRCAPPWSLKSTQTSFYSCLCQRLQTFSTESPLSAGREAFATVYVFMV